MNPLTGLTISINNQALSIEYGNDVFGPTIEWRKFNDIKHIYLDSRSKGPEISYGIAMDIGKGNHKELLIQKNILFGAMVFASGQIGNEPIKSQGHIHKTSINSGWSPPEIYEIWQGSAIIYMQEFVADYPGRCYAIAAEKGDFVVVPPSWAHCSISADATTSLAFGACCDRDYGFIYEPIKEKNGFAWIPYFADNNKIAWKENPTYTKSILISKSPEDYSTSLGFTNNKPLYSLFEDNPDIFEFVSNPALKENVWNSFIP
jgi:glucose-6-phosphate isomerase